MSTDVLRVECQPEPDGWTCRVVVGDDPGATSHVVAVDRATLARLDPDAAAPDALVAAAFRFLLGHEPRESILRSFDLPVVGRYFPDWESDLAEHS